MVTVEVFPRLLPSAQKHPEVNAGWRLLNAFLSMVAPRNSKHADLRWSNEAKAGWAVLGFLKQNLHP